MRKFYNSSAFRRHEHDRISTALAGGHDDETSCCSLSVDCRTPNFQVREGGHPRLKRLYMYYGNDLQYEVKKVSDIRANDYVFAHRTNSSQDQVDMIAIYKACAKALDDGMFVFQSGEFDCGNRYLEAANLYDPDNPWIKPDRLFPYYFRSSSPISGRVTWDEMNTGDFGIRHVFVVNTDMDEDLTAKIPDGTIVYIGGDHSREQLGLFSQYQYDSFDWDLPLKIGTSRKRFSSCICRHNDSQKGQGGNRVFHAQPSSSFSNCCNTTSCLSYEGYKVYWPTRAKVRNAFGVSQVPLSEVILSFIEVEAGFCKSGSVILMENNAVDAREMKAVHVQADELGGKLLPTVFKLLRSGVVQLHGGFDLVSGLMSWLMKPFRLSELMNTSGGSPTSIHCSEESGRYDCELIVVSKMKLAAVAAFAAGSAGLSFGVFKSYVVYTARKYSGILQARDQAPAGDQMFVFIYDTNKGLLFECTLTYHTVYTGNITSYLGGVKKGVLECWEPDLGAHRGEARFCSWI